MNGPYGTLAAEATRATGISKIDVTCERERESSVLHKSACFKKSVAVKQHYTLTFT